VPPNVRECEKATSNLRCRAGVIANRRTDNHQIPPHILILTRRGQLTGAASHCAAANLWAWRSAFHPLHLDVHTGPDAHAVALAGGEQLACLFFALGFHAHRVRVALTEQAESWLRLANEQDEEDADTEEPIPAQN
jgi:hypothetical protein